MTTKQTILRNLGIAVLTAGLAACNDPVERKAKYMEEGKQFMQSGDYQKAALAFKNVLQIDPKDTESHYQIGEAFSKQGKIEQAFNEYRFVVAQDPNHVMARVRTGQMLMLGHNVDEAEKMVDEALSKQPDNVEALVLKAGVQINRNNSDAAIASIEKALTIKPDDAPAMLMRASIDARLGKQDKAIMFLREAIGKIPDNIPLRSMLGGLYARNKQYDEAEEMLVSIIKLEPLQYQHYKSLAMFQAGVDQVDKAEATLRDAVQQLPDNDAAKTNLIDFLVKKRSPEIAIAELLSMLEKKPDDYSLRFKLSNLQMGKKDLDGAVATLKEIIEQDKAGPSGLSARDKLAAIYALTSRSDEAKTLIKEVLDADPRDSEALTLRGQFSLNENKILEAISDFRSVLVDQPNNIPVLKALARAHMQNNEDSLARENLEKVVAAAPEDEVTRLDLAGLLLKAGQKDQAKQQIDALLKINPKSLRGLEAEFKYYLVEKQWDKAQAIAKQVQQNSSNNDATGFYLSGLGYQAANKLEAAIESFQQALVKKPDAIEPLNELIKTYMNLKQPDKALAKLQQVVKQQPGHMIAYNLMGGVYLSEKKFSESKAAFLKALEIKPDWFGPYRSLALIELAQKNKAEAANILSKGLDKTKGALELLFDLARLYHRDGEHDKVIALYEEYYKEHPESMIAINNLASYLANYADSPANLERAAKLAEPLLKTNNANMVDTVGWIAYKQGNYDKARDIVSKALDLDPAATMSQYHLGMIYFKRNDKAKATEYLQKVIDGKVAFEGMDEAKTTLEKIQGSS